MTSVLSGVTIVFCVAWCIAALLHRRSAAMRHLVWTCALAATLLLAPLRLCLPHRAVTSAALPFRNESSAQTTLVVVASTAPAGPALDPSTVLATLWALGTLVMGLRLFWNGMRLRSTIRRARGTLPILTSADIRSPVVAGSSGL